MTDPKVMNKAKWSLSVAAEHVADRINNNIGRQDMWGSKDSPFYLTFRHYYGEQKYMKNKLPIFSKERLNRA